MRLEREQGVEPQHGRRLGARRVRAACAARGQAQAQAALTGRGPPRRHHHAEACALQDRRLPAQKVERLVAVEHDFRRRLAVHAVPEPWVEARRLSELQQHLAYGPRRRPRGRPGCPEVRQRNQQGRIVTRSEEPLQAPRVGRSTVGVRQTEADPFVRVQCRLPDAVAPASPAHPGALADGVLGLPCGGAGGQRQRMHEKRPFDASQRGLRESRAADEVVEMHRKEVAHQGVRLVQQGIVVGVRRCVRPQRPACAWHRPREWPDHALLHGIGEFPSCLEPSGSLPGLRAAVAARFRRLRLLQVDRRQVLVVADRSLEARGQVAPEAEILPDADTPGRSRTMRVGGAKEREGVGNLGGIHAPRPPSGRGCDFLIRLRLQLRRRCGPHGVAGKTGPRRTPPRREPGRFKQMRPRLRQRLRELLPAQLKRVLAGPRPVPPAHRFRPDEKPAAGLARHPCAVQHGRGARLGDVRTAVGHGSRHRRGRLPSYRAMVAPV